MIYSNQSLLETRRLTGILNDIYRRQVFDTQLGCSIDMPPVDRINPQLVFTPREDQETRDYALEASLGLNALKEGLIRAGVSSQGKEFIDRKNCFFNQYGIKTQPLSYSVNLREDADCIFVDTSIYVPKEEGLISKDLVRLYNQFSSAIGTWFKGIEHLVEPKIAIKFDQRNAVETLMELIGSDRTEFVASVGIVKDPDVEMARLVALIPIMIYQFTNFITSGNPGVERRTDTIEKKVFEALPDSII